MQVSGLAARLKQAEKDAALYNSREALFGKPTTDYNEVKKLWESFEPYQQFWSIAAAWKVCMPKATNLHAHRPQAACMLCSMVL